MGLADGAKSAGELAVDAALRMAWRKGFVLLGLCPTLCSFPGYGKASPLLSWVS